MSSNANFTPLGPNKRWPIREEGGASSANAGAAQHPIPSFMPRDNAIGREIGIQGEVLARAPLITGACHKCGFIGHLPFQCRNFIQLKPNQKTDIDISSTSSEEYTTPLTNKEDKKAAKKLKKERKKAMKKLEKKLKKEMKKSRKRRHSSSSSSDYSDSSGGSKHKRRRKKEKRKKNKDRRRGHSSSSSSDD